MVHLPTTNSNPSGITSNLTKLSKDSHPDSVSPPQIQNQHQNQKMMPTVKTFSNLLAQQTTAKETPNPSPDNSSATHKPANQVRPLTKQVATKPSTNSNNISDKTSGNEQPESIAPETYATLSATLETNSSVTTDTTTTTDKADPNKTLGAAIDTGGQADFLATMLLLPQHNIKLQALAAEASNSADQPITVDINSTQSNTKNDLAATYNQITSNLSTLPDFSTASGSETANLATPNMTNTLPNLPTYNNSPDNKNEISTPLNNHNWANEFSQKINWMSLQQNYVAELYLNPPDLGALDVTLNVSGNQADALFTSPHSAVRDAVELALPKLRELLADNGINLGSATVSDQPLRDRDPEKFMRQNSGPTSPNDGSNKDSTSTQTLPIDEKFTSTRRHIGMVDTFA